MLGLGSEMGVSIQQDLRKIFLGAKGQAQNTLNLWGLLMYPQKGTFANMKMLFLFLPQLAELVLIACLRESPSVRISAEGVKEFDNPGTYQIKSVWAQNGF